MNPAKSLDPTKRFSDRVENYIKYRPTYPSNLLPFLASHINCSPNSVIADIGSGTGILTELFLKNGNQVFAVEPNKEMRVAAQKLLLNFPRFKSLPSSAEATSLPGQGIDIITAGQAFHWFNPGLAQKEFTRILKPNGWVVLVWNARQTTSTPFLKAYENLLVTFGTDYAQVKHSDSAPESMVKEFYGRNSCQMEILPNQQELDFDGLKGRLLSSSYVPTETQKNFQSMVETLEAIFHDHQHRDRVTILYDTQIFYGHLSG